MSSNIKEVENMIYKIAYTFTSDKNLIEDLFQQGVIGYLKAQKNYKEDKNAKLTTYAKQYIFGEIYNYINGVYKGEKLNKDYIKMYQLVNRTREYLSQVMGKEPTVKEIANYLNINEEYITDLIFYMSNNLSIDYVYDNEDEYQNYFGTYDEYNLELDEYLSNLTDEERKVIEYKYINGYSQSEIAKLLNTSQSSVSRSESKGLERIRNKVIV